MTGDEYTETMDVAVAAARMLLALGDDLDQARATSMRAETLGPILEPTAYLRGGADNVGDQLRFLDAAIHLRDVCLEMKP
jgi:hypothetical protein